MHLAIRWSTAFSSPVRSLSPLGFDRSVQDSPCKIGDPTFRLLSAFPVFFLDWSISYLLERFSKDVNSTCM